MSQHFFSETFYHFDNNAAEIQPYLNSVGISSVVLIALHSVVVGLRTVSDITKLQGLVH